MDRQPMTKTPYTVEILSDEDEDEGSATCSGFSSSSPPPRPKKRLEMETRAGCSNGSGVGIAPPPTFLVIDDDPTPQKPNSARTPSFVAETPLSECRVLESDASMVKCSLAREGRSSKKLSGISNLICLESDNELDSNEHETTRCKAAEGSGVYVFEKTETSVDGVSEALLPSNDDVTLRSHYIDKDDIQHNSRIDTSNKYSANTSYLDMVEDEPYASTLSERARLQTGNCSSTSNQFSGPKKRKEKGLAADVTKNNPRMEEISRKKKSEEEKLCLLEEKKKKKQQEKKQKEALKAEAAAAKKIEKEKQKWETGKFALKSIVAHIDAKIVENGSIGGHLLSMFAEKGISFRITSNPIEKSILWRIDAPEHFSELSSLGSAVSYVLLVYQAEEFCDLIASDSLTENVHKVRSLYPQFTICYLINKLMSYINKCAFYLSTYINMSWAFCLLSEQNQYKNPSGLSYWRRPPVEEALAKLTIHYTKVHSRLCLDEAELAEHIVSLTFSLANCQFRKKLTWLSVHANGAFIPKDFIDKKLIKKSIWLKALVAIPKVQPRHAVAIYKNYPTMRSLLSVYMDPNKTVHEKEFLLKDLMTEGSLGREDRRLGEVCSKRVYRLLMSQSGGIKTDDVEEGADFFGT